MTPITDWVSELSVRPRYALIYVMLGLVILSSVTVIAATLVPFPVYVTVLLLIGVHATYSVWDSDSPQALSQLWRRARSWCSLGSDTSRTTDAADPSRNAGRIGCSLYLANRRDYRISFHVTLLVQATR